MDKPKVGLLLLASAWMRDVGLDAEGGGLTRRVEEAGRKILDGLRNVCDPVFPGIPATAAEAARAADQVLASGCDAVLLAPMVWCEDQILRAALGRLGGLPLILATLVPHDRLPERAQFQEMLAGSGTVGALQASGLLAREGRRFAAACGRVSDPAVYREIAAHARAAAAARRLRGSRFGLLPWRCEAMSVTWVDEVALRTAHGVELVPLGIERLAEAMRAVTAPELSAFRRTLDARLVVVRTDEASMEQGTRAAIAIARLAREEGLAGLAMNDLAPEMHRAIGLRPCLPELALSDAGFAVAMEADVAVLLSMRALHLFTGSAPLYTEIFTFDPDRNCLLMGHAGWHGLEHRDPAHDLQVIPDVEYQAVDRFPGAAIYFPFRPGPVTAVNAVYRKGGLVWSFFEGQSVGGPHLEGNCHLLCKLEEPAADLLKRATARGVSQHWAVVPGHHGAELGILAAGLGVRLER